MKHPQNSKVVYAQNETVIVCPKKSHLLVTSLLKPWHPPRKSHKSASLLRQILLYTCLLVTRLEAQAQLLVSRPAE